VEGTFQDRAVPGPMPEIGVRAPPPARNGWVNCKQQVAFAFHFVEEWRDVFAGGQQRR